MVHKIIILDNEIITVFNDFLLRITTMLKLIKSSRNYLRLILLYAFFNCHLKQKYLETRNPQKR